MRGWLAIVVATCACDRALGFSTTQPADGPSPDAPPMCPAGSAAPTFQRILHQVTTTQCLGYIPSMATKTAVALCSFGPTSYMPAYGAFDAELQPLAIAPTPAGSGFVTGPILSPEGDEIWIEESRMNMAVVDVFRGGDGSFAYAHDIVFPPNLGGAAMGFFALGSFTRGPDRHVIYADTSTASLVLHELVVDAAGNATEVMGTVDNLTGGTLTFPGPAMLAEDGLRLIVIAQQQPGPTQGYFYSARAHIGDPFPPLVAMTVPFMSSAIVDGFLTGNCGRLYFELVPLSVVFYVNEG